MTMEEKFKRTTYLKKDEVSSASEIFEYLNQNKRREDRIFHYTTYESLVTVIKNKSFRLTRLDYLNDKAEKTLISGFDTDQNYIMSFCNSKKEYVSMWAMYGKSSGIKIRLDFSCNKLEKCLSDNFYYDMELTNKIQISNDGRVPFLKRKIQVADVVYFDKDQNVIKHNSNPFVQLRVHENLKMQLGGFVKYDAWEFERERRLKVTLNGKHKNDSPPYIYLKLSDELIDDFSITYNPWISTLLQSELIKTLDRITDRTVKQTSSSNYGEIGDL